MKSFMIFTLAMALFSCGGESKKGGGSAGGEVQNTPQGSNPKDIGNVDNSIFNLKVFENETILYVLSSGDGYDNGCDISADAEPTDLMCRIDVPELTTVGQAMHLWFNIPPELCEFTQVRVPYFWSSEPTIGPYKVEITVLDDKDTPSNSGATCKFNDGASFTCADTVDMKWNAKDEVFECKWEDCCFGEYDQFKTTQIMDATVLTSETEEDLKKKWPGKSNRCLAGPAITNWGINVETPYGIFPNAWLKYTEVEGLNTVYDVLPPFVANGRVSPYSAWTANYFDPLAHRHDGFYASRISQSPYAVDPIDDRSGDGLSGVLRGNPYYEIQCLDAAREIRHRIRLSIREWNELSEFDLFKESQGTKGDPNSNSLTGDEGRDCESLDLGYPCNDYYDFDYLLQYIGGSYKTTPADVADRSSYFFNMDHDEVEEIAGSNKNWSGKSQIVETVEKAEDKK